MDFDSAFAYIESFTNLERTVGTSMRPYRLDRMKVLLEVFDNPQDSFTAVHISGSKGKGSTGLYIACALTEAGLKTGLYTSPHVNTYRERITAAGVPFPDDLLVDRVEYIKTTIERLPPGTLPGQDRPTTFELLTLLAYLTFREAEMEWGVIETGIGGRLDATNVLSPAATVHTPVELEHTDVLGDTIAKIASEKAGIIKPGSVAFSGYQVPEAACVFSNKADDTGVRLYKIEEEIPKLEITVDGAAWTGPPWRGPAWRGPAWRGLATLKDGDTVEIKPGMQGKFQVENGALAFLVTDWLLEKAGRKKEERRRAICDALGRAKLPGRMELISENPPVLIDAAHTPASASRLLEAYLTMFPKGGTLLFGSVLGKKPGEIAKILGPAFSKVIISTPGTFKPSDPEAVYQAFSAAHPSVELIPEPKAAFERALDHSGGKRPILVTGSFYMIAEVRPFAGVKPYAR